MGRVKRGGYIVEWWMGDHDPRHVHVYKDGEEVAKVAVPELMLLRGRLTAKVRKILTDLLKEERICAGNASKK